MFQDLTDEEIILWKSEVRQFLASSHQVQTISSSLQGISVTINHSNAWKILEELEEEQQRRRRGNNPFIQLDLRNA